jgi:hypothetical protein
MEYLTRKKLQQRFGLAWMDAERIVREQTGQALCRHPLPVACWIAAYATGLGLPALLPEGHHGWVIAAKAAAVPMILAGLVAARLVKREAILAAAQEHARPRCTG